MSDVGVPEVAGKFQVMPPPTFGEYQALEKSIIENGVQVPVLDDENGDIIDGHYRDEIASRLGIPCPRTTLTGLRHAQKFALALTLNIDRRHLNATQKRELLEKSIKADPHASDRQHGRRTGTSDKTAAKVREELEGRAEIPHTDTRTDTSGREQPASKPNPGNAVKIADSETTRVVKQINIAVGMAKKLAGIDGFTDAHRQRVTRTATKLMTAIKRGNLK